MPTIAIIGAGSGLGLAIARKFGHKGYNVALVSRSAQKLDMLVTKLRADGIVAERFVADAGQPDSLVAAVDAARERFGYIDVLEFSPHAGNAESMLNALDVTVDGLRPAVETLLFGTVASVQAVLPEMRERGTGTILIAAGTGSIDPFPALGAVNAAQAAARNWTLNLHKQLAETNVHVAHVAIGVAIGDAAPVAGYPFRTPAQLAEMFWDLHVNRDSAELVIAD